MRATFSRDYDYRVPGKPAVIGYKAGWSGAIPKAHHEAAEAAGALEKAPTTASKETADAGRG